MLRQAYKCYYFGAIEPFKVTECYQKSDITYNISGRKLSDM